MGGYSTQAFDIHNCIFVHIPKCAGTSVSRSLFGDVGPGHLTMRDYEIMFSSSELRTYFKFTFVRNPWDRLYSAFHYLRRGGMNRSDREWSASNLSRYRSFEEFVCDWVDSENVRSWWHFIPQWEFVVSSGGQCRLDFTGRYETLGSDFQTIAFRLGRKQELAHENRSGESNLYQSAYTHEMIDRVADVYARDISLFGYSFCGR